VTEVDTAVILLNLCLIGATSLFSTDPTTQQVLCVPIVLKPSWAEEAGSFPSDLAIRCTLCLDSILLMWFKVVLLKGGKALCLELLIGELPTAVAWEPVISASLTLVDTVQVVKESFRLMSMGPYGEGDIREFYMEDP
jgi:hypothetical protein